MTLSGPGMRLIVGFRHLPMAAACLLLSDYGPTQTSSEVRFRAAIGCIADIKRALLGQVRRHPFRIHAPQQGHSI
jgi:hypothetical protein